MCQALCSLAQALIGKRGVDGAGDIDTSVNAMNNGADSKSRPSVKTGHGWQPTRGGQRNPPRKVNIMELPRISIIKFRLKNLLDLQVYMHLMKDDTLPSTTHFTEPCCYVLCACFNAARKNYEQLAGTYLHRHPDWKDPNIVAAYHSDMDKLDGFVVYPRDYANNKSGMKWHNTTPVGKYTAFFFCVFTELALYELAFGKWTDFENHIRSMPCGIPFADPCYCGAVKETANFLPDQLELHRFVEMQQVAATMWKQKLFSAQVAGIKSILRLEPLRTTVGNKDGIERHIQQQFECGRRGLTQIFDDLTDFRHIRRAPVRHEVIYHVDYGVQISSTDPGIDFLPDGVMAAIYGRRYLKQRMEEAKRRAVSLLVTKQRRGEEAFEGWDDWKPMPGYVPEYSEKPKGSSPTVVEANEAEVGAREEEEEDSDEVGEPVLDEDDAVWGLTSALRQPYPDRQELPSVIVEGDEAAVHEGGDEHNVVLQSSSVGGESVSTPGPAVVSQTPSTTYTNESSSRHTDAFPTPSARTAESIDEEMEDTAHAAGGSSESPSTAMDLESVRDPTSEPSTAGRAVVSQTPSITYTENASPTRSTRATEGGGGEMEETAELVGQGLGSPITAMDLESAGISYPDPPAAGPGQRPGTSAIDPGDAFAREFPEISDRARGGLHEVSHLAQSQPIVEPGSRQGCAGPFDARVMEDYIKLPIYKEYPAPNDITVYHPDKKKLIRVDPEREQVNTGKNHNMFIMRHRLLSQKGIPETREPLVKIPLPHYPQNCTQGKQANYHCLESNVIIAAARMDDMDAWLVQTVNQTQKAGPTKNTARDIVGLSIYSPFIRAALLKKTFAEGLFKEGGELNDYVLKVLTAEDGAHLSEKDFQRIGRLVKQMEFCHRSLVEHLQYKENKVVRFEFMMVTHNLHRWADCPCPPSMQHHFPLYAICEVKSSYLFWDQMRYYDLIWKPLEHLAGSWKRSKKNYDSGNGVADGQSFQSYLLSELQKTYDPDEATAMIYLTNLAVRVVGADSRETVGVLRTLLTNPELYAGLGFLGRLSLPKDLVRHPDRGRRELNLVPFRLDRSLMPVTLRQFLPLDDVSVQLAIRDAASRTFHNKEVHLRSKIQGKLANVNPNAKKVFQSAQLTLEETKMAVRAGPQLDNELSTDFEKRRQKTSIMERGYCSIPLPNRDEIRLMEGLRDAFFRVYDHETQTCLFDYFTNTTKDGIKPFGDRLRELHGWCLPSTVGGFSKFRKSLRGIQSSIKFANQHPIVTDEGAMFSRLEQRFKTLLLC